MRTSWPSAVRLVEVGARDGLQNENAPLPVSVRVELIRRLVGAGLKSVEAGAFVSPKWVPQMDGSAEVLARVLAGPPRTGATVGAAAGVVAGGVTGGSAGEVAGGVDYPVLVPNLQGLEAALAAGAQTVAVFAAASDTFSQRNIHCSIAESLERFRTVAGAARTAGVKLRGYVSCVAGCPYEGAIAPQAVAGVAAALRALGCDEISLGDTIGTGNPDSIRRMLEAVLREVPAERLAGHYHDTYGMAVANVYASLELGLTVFDAAVGGLGGCPYAPGASGNVATEELVWLFDGLGIATGVDLEALVDTAVWIGNRLGRAPASRVARAVLARRRSGH
ncbi:hydroxymethylglutaryl-CoA lyase [Thauera aromatica]|uniref:hydroxymethylglutaryl-CoA lyase n=1 Tax=Thauera aromatica K172 TaxID=44139 RepID=A0A2R4BRJ2_THAAR|nr:hydroxymethylglutaryl-CoA lyase [Thauera aromatica]AVR89824.1 Hydroxymethylglutaryl-CoA lyase [Thauera aromatica K172]